MTDEEFFDAPMGSIPDAPNVPPGNYIGECLTHKTSKKKRDGVELTVISIPIRVLEPRNDVDEDLWNKLDPSLRYATMDFWLDARGRKAFDDFLFAMFGENTTMMKITDYMMLLVGRKVTFGVKHTNAKEKDEFGKIKTFVNLRNLKPLKEDDE